MTKAKASKVVEALLADDDPISREMMRTYLEKVDCRVRAASSGTEAMNLFEEVRGSLGLVVLDACMPGPSARVMYERISSLNPLVPVLFCSAFSGDDPALRFIGANGLVLLRKPFDRVVCVRAIRRALQQGNESVAANAGGAVSVGLETPCRRCGAELVVASGLAPSVVRESVRLRAAEYGFPITCRSCRTETVLGPALAAAPIKARPVAVYSSR